jgi:hypothetical protein
MLAHPLLRLAYGCTLLVTFCLALSGTASAAAPAYISTGDSCGIPPSSTKTVSASAELPFWVVLDYGRLKLTFGNVVWQLVNVETGLVEYVNVDPSTALPSAGCNIAPGPFAAYTLNSSSIGNVSGNDLDSGATYNLFLGDSSGAYKNIRFRVVP